MFITKNNINVSEKKMNKKRKRVVLSIEQKLEIIQKLENGQRAKALSVQYGIGDVTVRDLIKQKEQLLKFVCSSDSSNAMKKRKTMKKATYDDLDKELLEWFNNQRTQGNPVSGPSCAAKAKEFFNILGLEGPFEASSGWLTRFKQRHGIQELNIQGGKLSSNVKPATLDIMQDGGFQGFDKEDPAELASLDQNVSGDVHIDEDNINEPLKVDNNKPSFEFVSNQEILHRAQGIKSESYSDKEAEEAPAVQRIAYSTARQYVEALLDFLEGEGDSSICDLIVLRKIRSNIIKKEAQENNKKQ